MHATVRRAEEGDPMGTKAGCQGSSAPGKRNGSIALEQRIIPCSNGMHHPILYILIETSLHIIQ